MNTHIISFSQKRQSSTEHFSKFNEFYGNNDTPYVMFLHKEVKTYEDKLKILNTKKEYAYIRKGELDDLLSDLNVYNFSSNELYTSNLSKLKFKLTQKYFRDCIFSQPKSIIIEGEFYLLTESQFKSISFDKEPITSKRDIFMATKLDDRVEVNKEIKSFISKNFVSIKSNKEFNQKMLYIPIFKKGVERYVPKKINQKAFELSVKYNLNTIEFNFLNFFYDTKKSMRNGNGQLFFDINNNGIGWDQDRNWVKEKMKNLINLGLVKFETKHDCRDERYTSWYFYDSEKNLDELKHAF